MICKISCLLALSGLAGCTMGPDYHEVALEVPDHWQAKPTTNLKQANPDELKTWWKTLAIPTHE